MINDTTSALADGISRRQIGEITVASIDTGSMRIPARLFVPEDEVSGAFKNLATDGRFRCGLISFVAITPGGIVLVDPIEYSPEDACLPTDYLPSASLESALRLLGVLGTDVDHVIITHRHADHSCGALKPDGMLRFPNARHWIHQSDWTGLGSSAQGDGETALTALRAGGALHLIDADRELLPGVAIVHAPGETPGHCAVRITSDGATCYYLGDLVHHVSQIANPTWVPWSSDPTQLVDSRERLLDTMAAESALGVFTHARFPGWGRVVRESTGFNWEPCS